MVEKLCLYPRLYFLYHFSNITRNCVVTTRGAICQSLGSVTNGTDTVFFYCLHYRRCSFRHLELELKGNIAGVWLLGQVW